MGLYDYLPILKVECPHCNSTIDAEIQSKNLDRKLVWYEKDHVFENIPHRIFGVCKCDDCDEFFYGEAILKNKRIKEYITYKKEVCPFLRNLSTNKFYEDNNWGPFICYCKDGKIDALDINTYVCAAMNHDTRGKHEPDKSFPCCKEA